MKRFLLIILLSYVCFSCDNNVPVWKRWVFERPPPKPNGKSDYPSMYVKGWQDGCHTSAGATANHLYKNFFNYKKDEELFFHNADYKMGWNNSFRYCTSYILQHNFDWFGKRVI